MIPDGLLRLLEHDRAHSSDYVRILRVYLDQDRSIAETIRILYMHRNTFLYRIGRIQEILAMDLDNPDNRLLLQIALRLLDHHPAFQDFPPI